jgi:hypothetical protein
MLRTPPVIQQSTLGLLSRKKRMPTVKGGVKPGHCVGVKVGQ